MNTVFKWSFPLVAVLGMTACGGDSSGSDDSAAEAGEETASEFTSSAQWIIQPLASTTTCFDFDTNSEVTCADTEWDIKMVMSSRGSPTFFTNSGESGDGSGGTLGSPFAYTWETLQGFTSGLVDNDGNSLNSRAYISDSLDNAFANSENGIGSAIFEYTSSHKLLPNYGVILLTTNNSTAYAAGDENVYAMQVSGYYGGDTGSSSGYPTVRWVNLADSANVHTATLNAASGWVYFDLATGETVSDPDSESWQLAFSRYNVKTNSGISGSGSVGTMFVQQPDGFCDTEGAVVEAAFSDTGIIDAAKADLSDSSGWDTSGSWATDAAYSVLNPDYQGSYPGLLTYGFYAYNPSTHMLSAVAENGVMLRSGDGDTYARMHLSDLTYADSNNASSQKTWTFDFDVQPADD